MEICEPTLCSVLSGWDTLDDAGLVFCEEWSIVVFGTHVKGRSTEAYLVLLVVFLSLSCNRFWRFFVGMILNKVNIKGLKM